jgi:hypothetical protein
MYLHPQKIVELAKGKEGRDFREGTARGTNFRKDGISGKKVAGGTW